MRGDQGGSFTPEVEGSLTASGALRSSIIGGTRFPERHLVSHKKSRQLRDAYSGLLQGIFLFPQKIRFLPTAVFGLLPVINISRRKRFVTAFGTFCLTRREGTFRRQSEDNCRQYNFISVDLFFHQKLDLGNSLQRAPHNKKYYINYYI
jgi:hypothetical protein